MKLMFVYLTDIHHCHCNIITLVFFFLIIKILGIPSDYYLINFQTTFVCLTIFKNCHYGKTSWDMTKSNWSLYLYIR